MATLHVRNVPDELYEELRQLAEREGRSIGAEAVVLLRQALAERRGLHETLDDAVRRGSPFKTRFATRAQELVLRAQELAQDGGADETMPAHVLLAMLEDDVLRPTLERGGVTDESVRAALPPPAKPSSAKPVVSRDARQMLEQALLSALS